MNFLLQHKCQMKKNAIFFMVSKQNTQTKTEARPNQTRTTPNWNIDVFPLSFPHEFTKQWELQLDGNMKFINGTECGDWMLYVKTISIE